jgi:hypothetical protein
MNKFLVRTKEDFSLDGGVNNVNTFRAIIVDDILNCSYGDDYFWPTHTQLTTHSQRNHLVAAIINYALLQIALLARGRDSSIFDCV